jgi:RNAse (barnase) inhibitor barstar
MSGLAGLLAGHHRPGVYQWHQAFPVETVRHTVEHAGWRFAAVDGWTHQDKIAFLECMREAFEFPDEYGDNFDALVDCLRDVDADKGTVLLWDGWGPLAREDRHAFEVAVDVLNGRTQDEPKFAVLLRGEGPDIDVPALDA